MLPEGLFGVPPFLLVIPFAFVAGLLVFLNGAERAGISRRRVLILQLALSAAALFGARAFSWIVDSNWNPLASEPLPSVGGWRYPGGLFAFLIALPLLKPRLLPEVSLARYADLLAPTIAVAVGVLRFQCLLFGCCVGEVCGRFFCLSYAPESAVWNEQLVAGLIDGSGRSLPVFPLQMAMMAASLGVGAVLWRYDPRRHWDGEVFVLFLILHEGLKFAFELLRAPPLLVLQLSSLIPAVIGVGVWLFVAARRRQVSQAASDARHGSGP